MLFNIFYNLCISFTFIRSLFFNNKMKFSSAKVWSFGTKPKGIKYKMIKSNIN